MVHLCSAGDGVHSPFATKDYYLAMDRSGALLATSCLPGRCVDCNANASVSRQAVSCCSEHRDPTSPLCGRCSESAA